MGALESTWGWRLGLWPVQLDWLNPPRPGGHRRSKLEGLWPHFVHSTLGTLATALGAPSGCPRGPDGEGGERVQKSSSSPELSPEKGENDLEGHSPALGRNGNSRGK